MCARVCVFVLVCSRSKAVRQKHLCQPPPPFSGQVPGLCARVYTPQCCIHTAWNSAPSRRSLLIYCCLRNALWTRVIGLSPHQTGHSGRPEKGRATSIKKCFSRGRGPRTPPPPIQIHTRVQLKTAHPPQRWGAAPRRLPSVHSEENKTARLLHSQKKQQQQINNFAEKTDVETVTRATLSGRCEERDS